MNYSPSYRIRDLRPPTDGEPAFGQWNFEIREHGRLGVYGEGSSGPTELLDFLASASARIECPGSESGRELRVAYLPSEPEIDLNLDVMGNLNQAIAPLRKTEERYAQLCSDPEEHEDEFAQVGKKMDDCNIWILDQLLHQIVTGLDLPLPNAMGNTLSLAERKRVGLGMVLLQQPDIALIDLVVDDLASDVRAWLSQHLGEFPGTLLIASNDLELVEQVSNGSLIVGRSIEHREKPRIAGHARRQSGKPALYYKVVASPMEKGGPLPQISTVQADGGFNLFLSHSGEMRVEIFPPRDHTAVDPTGWWLNDQPLASHKPVQTGTFDLEFQLAD